MEIWICDVVGGGIKQNVNITFVFRQIFHYFAYTKLYHLPPKYFYLQIKTFFLQYFQ